MLGRCSDLLLPPKVYVLLIAMQGAGPSLLKKGNIDVHTLRNKDLKGLKAWVEAAAGAAKVAHHSRCGYWDDRWEAALGLRGLTGGMLEHTTGAMIGQWDT